MAHPPARTLGTLRTRAADSYVTRRLLLPAQDFIHRAGVSGKLLLFASAVAMVWANSPYARSYHQLWEIEFSIQFAGGTFTKTFHHLINDGLMTIFFFVVGLEIKRELVIGDLSSRSRAMMPVLGALGGMLGPALIYAAFNMGTPEIKGWGIPMATDIAFALGVLAIVGNRVPSELRILLLGIAIVDDIGSILVIALFYTSELNWFALLLSLVMVGVIMLMRKAGARAVASYVVVGCLVWLAVLKSGVHATLAGVVLGAITPLRPRISHKEFADSLKELQARHASAVKAADHEGAALALGEIEELAVGTESPLEHAERRVHPWVTVLVLPLFALANAGVAVSAEALRNAFQSRVAIGIVVGFIVGKFFGIFGFCWLAAKLKVAELPGRITWKHVAGMAMVSGIGFTVALFIAALSFTEAATLDAAKIAIMLASLLAAVMGALMLVYFGRGELAERRGVDREVH